MLRMAHGCTARVALVARLARFAAPALGCTLALDASARAGDPCVPPKSEQKEIEGCGAHSNNGCNQSGHPTEPIEFGVPIAGSYWANSQFRDTDFYRFRVSVPTAIRVRVWSTVLTQLAIAQSCVTMANELGECAEAVACLPPGVFNIFVAPLASYPQCGQESAGYVVLLEVDTDADPACLPLLGDLDGDGAISGPDLATLLQRWGSNDPGIADISGDGIVNGQDLGLLLGAWTG